MAAAAASGVVGAITFTAVQKGEQGNLINVAIAMPPGATGAVVLAESGNRATLYLAADGATGAITSTISGVKAGFADSRLVLATAGTDGNTGVAATGTLAAGASGTNGYDDLSAATTDGWALTNKTGLQGDVDVLEKVDRRKGGRVRVAAKAATGATNVVRSAYNEEVRRAKMGYPRSLMGASGSQAYEYVTSV